MFGRFNLLFFLGILFSTSLLHAIDYDAEIQLEQKPAYADRSIISSLKKSSSTFQLQKSPPLTFSSLKRRAEGDIENLQKVLKANGFLSAKIRLKTQFEQVRAKVIFEVQLGPKFTFDSVQIVGTSDSQEILDELEKIGIKKGQPFNAECLEDGNHVITSLLKNKGYPLSKIIQRTLLADRKHANIDVTFSIFTGPKCTFGPVYYSGNTSIQPSYFSPICPWKEGELFSEKLVEEMQKRLEKSGLFKSVSVKEGFVTDTKIPIEIYVEESPRRTIGAGLCYTTTYGPGIGAQWRHRNYFGNGERIEFRADLWRQNRYASLSYTIPNFKEYQQNLIYLAEYNFQTTISYQSSSVAMSALMENRLAHNVDFIRGGQIERLKSHGFDGNHLFRLGKIPFQIKWTSANSLLDPTHGAQINCKVTPTFQVADKPYPYLIHLTSGTLYRSYLNNALTLAAKAQVGNIFGESEHVIPLPDRFFGGSDSSLRGYKTYSVAPLTKHGIPMGGRSILTGTLEARIRTTTPLGWVLFYDVGNVYHFWFPTLGTPLLHSTGIGVRYNTPIGPMRLDVAFPLNRRHSIDPLFQIYFSIGQAF